MSKIKKEMILLLIFIFAVIYSISVFADEIGCCSNPGAGALTCSSERLVFRDTECCPVPESSFSSYYKSAQNPNNPASYNECSASYFFPNKACSGVTACTLGCCCAELGGTIKPEAQCKGTNVAFYKGETDCSKVCPAPQCNDATDNDNNGCADFEGGDLGCTSPADKTESGGSCVREGVGCSNPNYVPKLSNLEIIPAKGQKKFLLKWRDECSETAVSYEILRCKESGCTNFEAIGTTNTNFFEDASEALLFDATYTYQVKARYNIQTATPSITKTATLGNIECLGQSSSGNFCIHESYYNKYKDYLSANFPSDFKEFSSGVKIKFSSRFNKAFFCDSFNKIIPEGTSCLSSQVCVVSSNKPSCLSKANCNYNSANPFGLFYTLEDCETNKYCFYDRSHSTINSCYGCDTSMSCYDYKTEEACKRDNCRAGSCKWKNSAGQIGIGVCVSATEYNCKWCESKGTKILENTRAFNEVFDICTREKSSLLSEGQFKCYYRNGKSKNCNEAVCSDYDTGECSDSQILHDENNKIKNPSQDECGIRVCQNINNACVKNADGDNKADCGSAECEKDYFSPNTTLLPVIRKGVIDILLIQIYDRTSINSTTTLRTSSDYRTFLCVEPCSSEGHPYSASATGKSLIFSGLGMFDSSSGNKILELKEGANVIGYYSQDPAKNIEEIKKITVQALGSASGPKIFSISISGASKFLDKFYTSNRKPAIEVQFFEPAIITHARLFNTDTGLIVPFQFSAEPTQKVVFQISDALPNGEYVFELNAKNQNNVFMEPSLSQTIVIDDSKPIVEIIPVNGSVINSSNVAAKLTFNKEAKIESVKINSGELKESFSTTDNRIFAADLNLEDGNKNLEVYASDFAGNTIMASTFFVVDANPATIRLATPKYGTASKYTFDIVVETDNNAACRHSLDNNFEYEFMEQFTSTGGTSHKISSFSKIASGDTNIHKLHVRCKDERGVSFKTFDINVDITPPKLKSAFAFPNPIIEKPFTTTLTTEADEQTICKYSTAAKNFENMEGKFDGYDEGNFKAINRQQVTVDNESSYTYYVACKNKAELNTETKEISFKVDLTVPIAIISHTPEYFNSTNVVLAVETNKKSQCKYSLESTAQSGEIFGAPSYSHTKQLTLATGRHIFYIICKDQYLQKFSDVVPITFTIDITPPVILEIDDSSTLPNPEFAWNTDNLRVKWNSIDEETKVISHLYSLIEEGTGRAVFDYTKSFANNEFIVVSKPNGTSLGLANGYKYFFRVSAQNIVGLSSNTSESNGITIDTSLKPANCTNKALDEKESDVDCGFACDLCEIGKRCKTNIDCKSGFCGNGLCSAPKCDDNARNQDESDIDCGGNCRKCEDNKACSSNNDCTSNFCSFGFCKPQESCLDSQLSPGEADIDCGGYCPVKCAEDKSCSANEDCDAGLQCFSSLCKRCEANDLNCNGVPDEQETGAKDTDGDGLPDEWEIENGLNPNDPSDASLDSDNDGLTNIEEYNMQGTYGKSTNPNKADTDEDGFTDKEEIDKGTNPVDPADFPKSSFGKIIAYMLGTIILLAGLGYLGYRAVQKRKEQKLEMPVQRGAFAPIVKQPEKQIAVKREEAKIKEAFKKREEERANEREKLFEAFGKGERKEIKPAEKAETKKQAAKPIKKSQQKKPKEEVFARLKEIAKEAKKSKKPKANDRISKLYELAKSKKRK